MGPIRQLLRFLADLVPRETMNDQYYVSIGSPRGDGRYASLKVWDRPGGERILLIRKAGGIYAILDFQGELTNYRGTLADAWAAAQRYGVRPEDFGAAFGVRPDQGDLDLGDEMMPEESEDPSATVDI